MIWFFAIGFALGFGTGIPIGAVGVAVIDASYRHPLRRAVGVGLGGATGDMIYSGLGILGLGAVLSRHPEIPPLLQGLSGVALILYGAWQLRARPPVQMDEVLEAGALPPASGARHTRAGFALGLGLVLANPASIVTWVVIVGGFLDGITTLQGVSAVVGVACGSAAWFVLLAHIARRGTHALGSKAAKIGRVAGALLSCYGLFSLVRGASYWLGMGVH